MIIKKLWRNEMNKNAIPILTAIAMATIALGLVASVPLAFADNEVNASVTLNMPLLNGYNKSAAPNIFVATPATNGTDPSLGNIVFLNCTLWINKSGTWQFNNSNASAIVNNTALAITVSGLSELGTSYKWNVNCTTNNTEKKSYVASNRTSMFDRSIPNITVTRPRDAETFSDNPGYYSVSANKSVNFSVRAFNSINTIENISMTNSSTTATYNYVFYSSNRMYWAQFFANDSAGNVGVYTNYTFWYNVTSSTGGGGGGRTVIPLVITEPAAPIEAPTTGVPTAVGPVEAITGVFRDIANAIAGAFSSLLKAIGL